MLESLACVRALGLAALATRRVGRCEVVVVGLGLAAVAERHRRSVWAGTLVRRLPAGPSPHQSTQSSVAICPRRLCELHHSLAVSATLGLRVLRWGVGWWAAMVVGVCRERVVQGGHVR